MHAREFHPLYGGVDTIITSEPEKLPEWVRGLLDEGRPLPPGVFFFEQRYTAAVLMRRVLIAAVLFVVALGAFLFSLEFLWFRHIDPKYREFINFKELIVSVVCACCGWMMLSSIGAARALARRQAAGERTRHGIFLAPEALVSHSQFDTTVIPPERFRGLENGAVQYLVGDAPKSFGLPSEWVGATPAGVAQAIAAWRPAAPPPAMPPPPPSA